MIAEEALEIFEARARPYLDMVFKPSTCIEQARILIEVLKRFGIAAEPLATKFHVECKQCECQFFASGDPADHERARGMPKGVIERPNDRGELHGYHTVVLVERRLFVDLTVAQASMPEFGFYLKPCIVTLPFSEPLAEDMLPDIGIEGANDDGISFRARWIGVNDRDWEGTPAWEPSHLWPLIDRIEMEMWTEWLERYKKQHPEMRSCQ